MIPKVPGYTAIHKRINKLDTKIDPKVGSYIVLAIDSTGIKVANRREWMRDKWKKRRDFSRYMSVWILIPRTTFRTCTTTISYLTSR